MLLVAERQLPAKYCDHGLTGDWADHCDCYINPDLVLIYQKSDDETLRPSLATATGCVPAGGGLPLGPTPVRRWPRFAGTQAIGRCLDESYPQLLWNKLQEWLHPYP